MSHPDRPPRGRLTEAVRYLLIGLGAGAVGGVVGYESGAPAPWVIGVACLAAVLLAGLGITALADYRPPEGAPRPGVRRAPTDRESGGLRRVERSLEAGMRDVDRFNLRVRPWLVQLADQRLRHRAGVDPARDPESARELLGGTLWQLTQQPLTTPPTRGLLAEWVSRLEQL